MINILSYVGMDLQSEVCMWTLLGLLRTIFDATLFKVNANLKQVWQMKMPEELTRPVQRVLRTMISGVILVQCFTLYVYLASYIVLLYPVFLEERPTLVLPWLLLAAIRKLLCELMSLALGLGTCVLLGPARPPCIKFVIVKLASITPAFYMWLLVFSYYHVLKMSTAFKTFTAVYPPNDRDYGLELAVRRRMTKSLQGEDQLRRKLIASLYGERNTSMHVFNPISSPNIKSTIHSPEGSIEDISINILRRPSVTSNRTMSDIGTYEDWFGSELALPPDTDRILEQFGLMLLRIAAFLGKDEIDRIKCFNTSSQINMNNRELLKCTANDDTDTPPHVGSRGRAASYLTEYPQIFMKKTSDLCRPQNSEHELIEVRNTCTTTNTEGDEKCINCTNSENFINYEVSRRMKEVEVDLRNKKTVQGALHIRESNNDTSRIIRPSHSKKQKSCEQKCKATNTTCGSNDMDKSLCPCKISESAECCLDKIESRETDNIISQESKMKQSESSSSSSKITLNSN